MWTKTTPTAQISPPRRAPLRRRRRGYMFLDVLIALMLLALLATALAVTSHSTAAASGRLAESRGGLRRAEAILTQMQAGQAPAQGTATDVAVETVDVRAPAGSRWVRVTAVAGRSRAVLFGVVPAAAAGGPTKAPAK